MLTYMLDTNICIYIRQRRPPSVLQRFRQLQPGDAVLSVITYGELVYGAEKSRLREQARNQLAELVGLLPVLELPPRAGDFYGSIHAALQAEGLVRAFEILASLPADFLPDGRGDTPPQEREGL